MPKKRPNRRKRAAEDMRDGILLSTGLHVGAIALAISGLPSFLMEERRDDGSIVVEIATVDKRRLPTAEPPKAPEPKPPAVQPEPEPAPPEPEPAPPEPEPAPPEPEPAPPEPEPAPSEPEPAPSEPEPAPPEPEPAPPEPEPAPPEPEPAPPEPKPAAAQPDPPPVPPPRPSPPNPPRAKPPPAAPRVDSPRPRPDPPPSELASVLKNLARERASAGSEPGKPTQPIRSIGRAAPGRSRISDAILIRSIRRQIEPCWNPPVGAHDAHEISVLVRIRLNPDGTLAGRPSLDSRGDDRPAYRAVADSAIRALQNPRCSPLDLPYDSYHAWRDITLNFDLRDMLR